jgi:hypothetical protein
MCLHCGFSPAAQIFQSNIYSILMKVQTFEKLGRPHCGFFPAAQIFHSDIYTTLMKVQTSSVVLCTLPRKHLSSTPVPSKGKCVQSVHFSVLDIQVYCPYPTVVIRAYIVTLFNRIYSHIAIL